MRHALLAAVALGLCVAGQAKAADLRMYPPVTKAPPAPVYAAYDWSGFYLGVHGGGVWGSKDFAVVSSGADEGRFNLNGWLVGGQIGFNWQFNAVVLGIEADGSFADVSGDRVSRAFPTDRIGTEIDSLGTITGRLGYAFDNVLFYAKGGAAWVHDQHSFTDIPSGITYATIDDTRWGWTVGAGFEYAFAPDWSLKLEYNFMDFGTAHYRDVVCPLTFCDGAFDENVKQHIHAVKIGVNYRFNGPMEWPRF